MRNINELIGIIKGINFDNVINEKEVSRLKMWVDRNRNLAYEPKQVELINLVDGVLEDNIDEDKKNILISGLEDFLHDVGNNSGKIYELNGIIDGIVCDGEVNEAEIIKLKNWIDEYGELIKDNKEIYDLCVAINKILEAGIVIEDPQNLLEILKDKITYAQLEIKLKYICNLVKDKKNIGIELIDVLTNEFVIKEIHKRAEQQLMMAVGSSTSFCTNGEMVVVSLVLIAMLEYDGNYYRSVREIYKQVYSRFSEQKVEGTIRAILSRYKKKNDASTRERIINVALENAIVPKNFLSAFFEFIFDIYKLNFNCNLPEELYDDFKFVYEGLRSNMLSTGDEISINVTQKSYKLIASTKQLITKEDGLDAVIKLSILIVKLIDRRFWDKEVKIFNPYLKVGYAGWEKHLKENGRRDPIIGEPPCELRSRWEHKFVLGDNNVLFLVPSAHRIKAQYDYSKVSVIVLNGEEEVYYDDNCLIKEIIGGYQIEPPKIKIDKPLGKLKYRLQCGDAVIYDSKDKLYRNCIVFNDKGQEISNNTDYEGTAYFVYKYDEAALNNILTTENYSIAYKFVEMGDVVSVGNDVFNFSSMVKPGILGQLHKNCLVRIDDDKYLSVYKEANEVFFEAENGPGTFEIKINDKVHKLSEMQYKTIVRENITKYVVNLDIAESGIYSVEINMFMAGKKNRILNEVFVFDKELSFETQKIDEISYNLKVSSGIMDRPVDKEFAIDEFEPELIHFKYDSYECAYLLPLDLGFYRINEDEWHMSTEELWIDQISLDTKIQLYDSECDGVDVFTENGVLAEDNLAVVNKGAYKEVSIGFLNSYKVSNRYVWLSFTAGGKERYKVFCYNKCVIDEEKTEIKFSDNPKQITVTPVFHGNNHVFFEIIDKNNEKVYKSELLRSGQTEIVPDLNSFEEYIFYFHEKAKKMQLGKVHPIHIVKRAFYAQENFVGRVFKITVAYFDKSIRGKLEEKKYEFRKMYVRITEKLEESIFRGEILVKTFRGEWKGLNNINPVKVEICGDIVDDTMCVYMTANSGDGLLMDFHHHGILNAIEDHDAPDIFLFNVSMRG